MSTKVQPIDILQIIFDRMNDAEKYELIEHSKSYWYSLAIKDLASYLWLDPDNYWIKQK